MSTSSFTQIRQRSTGRSQGAATIETKVQSSCCLADYWLCCRNVLFLVRCVAGDDDDEVMLNVLRCQLTY